MNISTITQRVNGWSGNTRGAAILMVAALLFTVMVTLIKYIGEDLHVTQILFIRQMVMTLIVAPQILNGFPGALATRRPGLQFARIVCALTAMLCGFTAIIHLPLADATAIGFTKSFFVTIFAMLILSEAVGPRRWMAVIAGFAGVAVMMDPGSGDLSYYSILALVGAAGAGMVMVLIRLMSKTESSTTILSWQALGVGLATAVPAIYFWQWPTLTQWALLIAMGGISYVAQMANISAYRWGEASVMASLDYVRLLYATLFGWLFFATFPGINTWIGAGIIVAASIYTVWREARRNQRLARSPEGRGYSN